MYKYMLWSAYFFNVLHGQELSVIVIYIFTVTAQKGPLSSSGCTSYRIWPVKDKMITYVSMYLIPYE